MRYLLALIGILFAATAGWAAYNFLKSKHMGILARTWAFGLIAWVFGIGGTLCLLNALEKDSDLIDLLIFAVPVIIFIWRKLLKSTGARAALLVGAAVVMYSFTERGTTVITGNSAVNSATPNAISDKWTLDIDKSKMDDSPLITLALKADNDGKAWLKSINPTLMIRCREKKLSVYVITQTPISPELGKYERYTVRLRFDDKKPVTEYWVDATNMDGLFAPNASSTIKQLAAAKRLRFEFVPFNAATTIIEFSIAGLDKHISQILGACRR